MKYQALINKIRDARKAGATYRALEAQFKVPKSTLFSYCKGITLDELTKKQLYKKAGEQAAQTKLNNKSKEGFFKLDKQGNITHKKCNMCQDVLLVKSNYYKAFNRLGVRASCKLCMIQAATNSRSTRV